MKHRLFFLLLLSLCYGVRLNAQCELPINNPVVTPLLMTANGLQASQSFTIPNCSSGFFSQLTIYTETNNSNVTLRICPGTPPFSNSTNCYEQTGISWSVVNPQSFTINLANDDPLLAYSANEVYTFELSCDAPFQLGLGGDPVDVYADGNYYNEDQQQQANQDLFFSFSSVATLPVTYSHFTARRIRAEQVELRWETQTEFNNRGFVVERRDETDSRWKQIGFAAAQEGNEAVIRAYTFLDFHAGPSSNYYRLRQEDYDGDYAYSSIVLVSKMETAVSCYPNPLKKGSSLNLSETAQLRLYDLNGRQLFNSVLPAQRHSLPTSLEAGYYLVGIRAVGGVEFRQTLLIAN